MTVLDAHEAAAFLRVHYNTITIWAKQGKIPGRKVGNQWRFIREHLADWISGNYTEQQAPEERVELKIIGGTKCQSTSAAARGGSTLDHRTASTYNDLLKLKQDKKNTYRNDTKSS
ncbi:helix-turn-helix domain-containing protein [Methylobacter sp. BBA5.1]|uniref:helix-turn-helix domain-containing protein n=1 Tax=Methylobacter sp. BBA5.1 TaxID=1495064 RepID=UPI000559FA1C|nr:helix-turn-helix domain-containing protein [Methylobacter sp. BBA5.1]